MAKHPTFKDFQDIIIQPTSDEFNVNEGCSLALSLFDNYGGDLEGSCPGTTEVAHYMMRKRDEKLFYFSGYKLTVGQLEVDPSSGVPVFTVPLECPGGAKIVLRRTMLNDKVSQTCKADGTKLDVWVALATTDDGASIAHPALFVEHRVGNERRIRTLLMPDGGAMPTKSIASMATMNPKDVDAAKGELRHIMSSIRVMGAGKDEPDGASSQTLASVQQDHNDFIKEQALSASHDRIQSIRKM